MFVLQLTKMIPDEISCFIDDDIGYLGSGQYGTVRLGFSKKLVAVKFFPSFGNTCEKNRIARQV